MRHIFTLIILSLLIHSNSYGQLAVCQDVEIGLDQTGYATISPEMVYNGSGQDISTFEVNLSSFSCADLGPNLVILTVTDNQGNTGNCTSTVTVVDLVAPVVICNDINNWSVENQLTANDIGQFSDNCSISSSLVLPSTFAQPGTYSVSLIVFDTGGSASTCVGFVSVIGDGEDNEAPVIVQCAPGVTVDVDESCEYIMEDFTSAITAQDNITSSEDLIVTQSPTAGTIMQGAQLQLVTLTVTDEAGISSLCVFPVNVEDNFIPTILNCPQNQTIDFNGTYIVPNFTTEIGAYDNCTDNFELVVLQNPPIGSSITQTGVVNVQIEVQDNSVNSAVCNFVITLENGSEPIAECQDITINLDANGSATITTDDINNGSSIGNLSLSQEDFTCDNVGPNMVVLTASNSGQNVTCESVVTIIDSTEPVAICQDVILTLDDNGSAVLLSNMIDAGSSDNCGISSYVIGQENFGTSNIGANSITFTVIDNSGNASICTSTVTVQEQSPLSCQNISIPLSQSGSASIEPSDLTTGIFISLELSQTDFDCSNIGTNLITVTATDDQGQTFTCDVTVAVEDIYPPTVACQNYSAYLDENGIADFVPQNLVLVSFDECGFATLSSTELSCDNIGENIVTITATDASGNMSTCESTVILFDTIAPIAICQSITVGLNGEGSTMITASMINDESMDNCSLEIFNLSQTVFNTEDIGENDIELTVTDAGGNSSSCTSIVTVQSELLEPTMTCPNDMSVEGNGDCTLDMPSFQEEAVMINFCSPLDELTYTQIPAIGEIVTGTTDVTLTVVDECENTSTCSFAITISGLEIPLIEEEGTISTSVEGINYQWYVCGGNAIQGANESTFTPEESGEYSVFVITGACGGSSDCIEVIVTGIEEQALNYDVSLFPNPNNGQFTVRIEDMKNEDISLQVYNNLGQLILSKKIYGEQETGIDLGIQSAGMYSLRLGNEKGYVQKHFIIE